MPLRRRAEECAKEGNIDLALVEYVEVDGMLQELRSTEESARELVSQSLMWLALEAVTQEIEADVAGPKKKRNNKNKAVALTKEEKLEQLRQQIAELEEES